MEYRTSELSLTYSLLLVSLTLSERLTDTEDNLQTVSESEVNLLLENLWSLVIVLTTLWVTEDNVLCTCWLNHLSRNLTCVSARSLVCAVLSRELDAAALDNVSNACEVDEWSTDDNLTVRVLYYFSEFLSESNALLQVLVHFPVTCYDFLSHFLFWF